MLQSLTRWLNSPSRRRRAKFAPVVSGPAAVELLEDRKMLSADVVLQWNEIMLDAIRTVKPPPPVASRAMAIVSVAVFDTINSIEWKYNQYLTKATTPLSTSKDAAVAQAAYRTLSALFPTYQATLDAQLAATLGTVVDGTNKTAGIALGNTVATAILNLRSTDGSSTSVTYVPGTDPGEWRPTPNGFAAALLPNWPNVKPFTMTSKSQFRPAAPPALGSAAYATDYNQVLDLGSATSLTRTADQTDIAAFWAGGGGTATPPGQWNMIARAVSQSQCLTPEENARMFAMLNVALADAAISSWDAKYAYNLWRPVSAIREGSLDGNAATIEDAAWTPLLNTPAFPSYTSGHSTFSGAGAAVLGAFFGTNDVAFVLESEASGVGSRGYTGFKQAAEEAGMSRIYGGIHFNFDNTAGLKAGEAIGKQVAAGKVMSVKPSVVLQGGLLTVTGTNTKDTINVDHHSQSIFVNVNGKLLSRVTSSQVSRIMINAGDGDDTVTVTSRVLLDTLMEGGNGNDILNGGAGRDTIYGGAGKDRLYGNAGADFLYGEDGDDMLDGGKNNDFLSGGLGVDTLYVTRDADTWETGPGIKRIIYR